MKGWDDLNNGFPSETLYRSMTPPITKFIRPNNYRRIINIKFIKESGIKSILTTPLAKQNSQNHIIDIPNYRSTGISLQVCKSKLIGIYSQVYSNGKKYWYRITRDSDEEINKVIEAKKEEIKDKIDSALKMFCEEFNLGFRFENPIWLRSETAIHGDDYIDRIPRDLIVHNTIFKKVYKDDLEFKSGKGEEPVVHLKNYITNRAIEKISPEIAKELSEIKNERIEFNKSLALYTEQINLHLKVEQRQLEVQEAMLKHFEKEDKLNRVKRLKEDWW
jgi:hypothetical protein